MAHCRPLAESFQEAVLSTACGNCEPASLCDKPPASAPQTAALTSVFMPTSPEMAAREHARQPPAQRGEAWAPGGDAPLGVDAPLDRRARVLRCARVTFEYPLSWCLLENKAYVRKEFGLYSLQ